MNTQRLCAVRICLGPCCQVPGSNPLVLSFSRSQLNRRDVLSQRAACFLWVGKLHCSSPYVIRMCLPSGWHFNLALHCQSGGVNNKYMKSVKNLPAVQEPLEMQVWSLVVEDPLEEGMATHSSILAWRIPWTENLLDRGVHGVTKSQTQLKQLRTHAHST